MNIYISDGDEYYGKKAIKGGKGSRERMGDYIGSLLYVRQVSQ